MKTRGRKRPVGRPRGSKKQRTDNEFVIDWDLIDSMAEVETAASIASATTKVLHIPSLFCPEDDSTLGSASVDYEMSEDEKWDIFVDAMCDVDLEEGDDTSFNTLVAGISQNLTQDGASEVSTLNTPSQTQDTATASTITQSQAEFMSQPMRVPRQIITRQT